VARPSTAKRSKPTALDLLAPGEQAQVLHVLIAAHPDLAAPAEQLAAELLGSVSVEQVASDVEAALVGIPLDALATRAGRVRGRGYVHEVDAAWELVEEAIEPFRSDLQRRATLGLLDAAANVAIGIVAGLHAGREPEMGTVMAYAGEDAPVELASGLLGLAADLGVPIPEDAAGDHWPDWIALS
jgi:hypothetical protein